jgi:hypothetical protein
MTTTRRRGSRVMHGLLMLPALAVGVLLLAVFVADHNGASLGELFSGDVDVDLTPASWSGDAP